MMDETAGPWADEGVIVPLKGVAHACGVMEG